MTVGTVYSVRAAARITRLGARARHLFLAAEYGEPHRGDKDILFEAGPEPTYYNFIPAAVAKDTRFVVSTVDSSTIGKSPVIEIPVLIEASEEYPADEPKKRKRKDADG